MAESAQLRRLREIRAIVVGSKLSDDERKRLRITDVDGNIVRLDSLNAAQTLDQLISAQEAKEAP